MLSVAKAVMTAIVNPGHLRLLQHEKNQYKQKKIALLKMSAKNKLHLCANQQQGTSMKQLKLQTQGWGGIREGAGRKHKKNAGISHLARPVIQSRYPLHVTVKLSKGLPSLRTKSLFKMFRQALREARGWGLKTVEFAVLSNHIHLLVEASNNEILAQSMKSLNVRIAKNFNRITGHKGSVFHDRYDLHVLKTPTEVRNALIYIFENAAKHLKKKELFDWYSSYCVFNRVKELFRDYHKHIITIPDIPASWITELQQTLSPAASWLATNGWCKAKIYA